MNSELINVESCLLNNKRIFAFKSRTSFLDSLEGQNTILIALNAEKLNKQDDELQALINDNIGYADGIGAVLALRTKGIKSIKIPGAEFWLDIVERYNNSKKFYILGGTPSVLETTIGKLKTDFSNINIVGSRNGYFDKSEIETIKQDLKYTNPDIIFVAMGSPKQEFLMAEFLIEHPALYMGLGGSFDVYSDVKKRAPKIFLKLGLEWLYRLLKEPTRVGRQLNLVSFTIKILLRKI